MNSWRLIAPAEDWSQPLEIDESVLPVLAEVARRLELRITRDDGQKKLYLGLPQEVPASVGSDILYPSGKRLSLAQLSEAQSNLEGYGTTGSYQAAPLVVAKIEDKLSDHFRAGEFFPHDPSYRYLRVSPELVLRLEQIRKALGGRAVTLHSAYRPPAYNRQVGGVANSAHVDGLAADISVADVSTERLRQVCEQIIGDSGGVGYYPTQQFVHIDVRGSRSRWTG